MYHQKADVGDEQNKKKGKDYTNKMLITAKLIVQV